MYQNIFYERTQNLIHLWDDKNGYQTFPYRKYAYKKDPYGQHTSMHGDRLTRISKWEKDEAEDLFESDVPETTRVLVDIYDSDTPSKGNRTMTFDIEVEMVSGLPNTQFAQNEITAIASHDGVTKLYDVFVLDKARSKIMQNNSVKMVEMSNCIFLIMKKIF
jgi:hypothetical protein